MNSNHSQTNETQQLTLTAALVFSMLLWGVSWISGKYITELAPLQLTVFYRLLFAALSMFPIALLAYKFKLVTPSFNRRIWLFAIPAGCLLAFYNQLFFLGLNTGLPGKGGMLVTTLNPIFTFILSFLIFKQSVNRIQQVGLFLGLTGGLLMIEIWQFSYAALLSSGNLFFISSALVWALLTLTSQKGAKFGDFLIFSSLMYLVAAVISVFFALPYNPIDSLFTLPINYWYHMAFLSVVVISIATSVFFLAAQRLGSNTASSFVFVVPITAMGLSAFIFDEALPLPSLVGGLLALTAVYLINTKSLQLNKKTVVIEKA